MASTAPSKDPLPNHEAPQPPNPTPSLTNGTTSPPSSNPSNPTVDGSTSPVLTPFLYPDPSSHPQPPPPLTASQSEKYTSLLSTVSSWTSLPTTSTISSSSSSEETTPLSPTERLFLTRECLLRYLRATKWSLPTATTRLRNTLIWRREYGVEALSPSYISPENETGKQVILGYDIHGRPCLYLNPKAQNTDTPVRQVQHLVFMLERTIDLMPPGQETLALVVNMAESAKRHPSISQARQVLNILQTHYPERLGRALVLNVPWMVWGFFKLITPFIDPMTKEKLKFEGKDLKGLVPEGQLLRKFGGEVEFEYRHGVYWPGLCEEAERRREGMRRRWEGRGGEVGGSEVFLRGGAEEGESSEGLRGGEGVEKGLEGMKVDGEVGRGLEGEGGVKGGEEKISAI